MKLGTTIAVHPGSPRSGAPAGRARRSVAWRLAGGCAWLALALGACIIEEREYSQQLDDCWVYCDALDRNCSGSNSVYDSRESCMSTCMLMENGRDTPALNVNTLACRLEKLLAPDFESPQCPLVGPGGGGACGTNCEALCTLRSQVCRDIETSFDTSDVTDVETCQRDCEALFDRQVMNAEGVDQRGDSVQCRLVYISRAASSPDNAEQNCRFSQIVPEPGEDTSRFPCSDPPGLALQLECEKYCNIAMTACTGPTAVYRDEAQCLDTCRRTMVPGEPGDTTTDTVRCRRYHAYYSLLEPTEHCLHASATGDGHCGVTRENCTAYCRVLQTGCGEQFAATFGATAGTVDGGASECIAQCGMLASSGYNGFALPDPPLPRYQLDPPPTGNSVMCRAYHAVEALTDPAGHCAAAFGGAPCR